MCTPSCFLQLQSSYRGRPGAPFDLLLPLLLLVLLLRLLLLTVTWPWWMRKGASKWTGPRRAACEMCISRISATPSSRLSSGYGLGGRAGWKGWVVGLTTYSLRTYYILTTYSPRTHYVLATHLLRTPRSTTQGPRRGMPRRRACERAVLTSPVRAGVRDRAGVSVAIGIGVTSGAAVLVRIQAATVCTAVIVCISTELTASRSGSIRSSASMNEIKSRPANAQRSAPRFRLRAA